jgi:hypothetical protein
MYVNNTDANANAPVGETTGEALAAAARMAWMTAALMQ